MDLDRIIKEGLINKDSENLFSYVIDKKSTTTIGVCKRCFHTELMIYKDFCCECRSALVWYSCEVDKVERELIKWTLRKAKTGHAGNTIRNQRKANTE